MAFDYDDQLAQIVLNDAGSIAGVVAALQAIDAVVNGSRDGLKWFNSLYLEVTLAVEARIAAGTFDDPQGTVFIASLDPVFANFYFAALRNWLAGREAPRSWSVFFEQRPNTALARIQFALAGVNAHINRDLAVAITMASKKAGIAPTHVTAQYRAYTALNETLDGLVEKAKRELMVTLPGDSLPGADRVEMMAAAWSVAAAREAAWVHSEVLSTISGQPLLAERFIDALDGTAELAGKALLLSFA